MNEPLFEEVRAELAKEGERAQHVAADFAAGVKEGAESVARAAEAVFGHGRYHASSVTENVPEETMDLAAVAADIRNDLQQAEDKAGEVYNHAKAVLEEKLPAIEGAVKDIGNDPLFKLAYDATIPSSVRALIAEFGAKVVALLAEAPAADAGKPAEAPAA